jgi:hypothetical protein
MLISSYRRGTRAFLDSRGFKMYFVMSFLDSRGFKMYFVFLIKMYHLSSEAIKIGSYFHRRSNYVNVHCTTSFYRRICHVSVLYQNLYGHFMPF